MPITVTVKTLDARNNDFTVDDGMDIKAFKEHIAQTIGIAADRQKVILRGKVLQGEQRMKDLDVDGKVLHIVEKAIPSTTTSGGRTGERRSASAGRASQSGARRPEGQVTTTRAGHLRTNLTLELPEGMAVDPASMSNTVLSTLREYGPHVRGAQLGTRNDSMHRSMQVSIDLRQTEGGLAIEGHSESGNRIITLQRMGRALDDIIARLEDTSLSPEPSHQPDFLLPCAHNAQFMSQQRSQPSASAGGGSTADSEPAPFACPVPASGSSAPPAGAGATGTGSTGTGSAGPTNEPPAQRRRAVHPTTVDLARVLGEMERANTALSPHISQYRQLLAQDPELSEQAEREAAERLMNLCSAALHYQGHMNHIVSDIMVDLRSERPRQLHSVPPAPAQPTAIIHQSIPVGIQISERPPRASSQSRASRPTRGAAPTTNASTSASTATTTSTASAFTSTASAFTSTTSTERGRPSTQGSSQTGRGQGQGTPASGQGQGTPASGHGQGGAPSQGAFDPFNIFGGVGGQVHVNVSGGGPPVVADLGNGQASTHVLDLGGNMPGNFRDMMHNMAQQMVDITAGMHGAGGQGTFDFMAAATGAQPSTPSTSSSGNTTSTSSAFTTSTASQSRPAQGQTTTGPRPAGPQATRVGGGGSGPIGASIGLHLGPPPNVAGLGGSPLAGLGASPLAGMHAPRQVFDPYVPCLSNHWLRFQPEETAQVAPQSPFQRRVSDAVRTIVEGLFREAGLRLPERAQRTAEPSSASAPRQGTSGAATGAATAPQVPTATPPTSSSSARSEDDFLTGLAAGLPSSARSDDYLLTGLAAGLRARASGAQPGEFNSADFFDTLSRAMEESEQQEESPTDASLVDASPVMRSILLEIMNSQRSTESSSWTLTRLAEEVCLTHGLDVPETTRRGIAGGLAHVLTDHLRMSDLQDLICSNLSSLNRLRVPLREFIKTTVLNDALPTETHIHQAVIRMMAYVETGMLACVVPRLRPGFFFQLSLTRFFRDLLERTMLYVIQSTPREIRTFGQGLHDMVLGMLKKGLRLLRFLLCGSRPAAYNYMRRLLSCMHNWVNPAVIAYLRSLLRQLVDNYSGGIRSMFDDSDLRPWLVGDGDEINDREFPAAMVRGLFTTIADLPVVDPQEPSTVHPSMRDRVPLEETRAERLRFDEFHSRLQDLENATFFNPDAPRLTQERRRAESRRMALSLMTTDELDEVEDEEEEAASNSASAAPGEAAGGSDGGQRPEPMADVDTASPEKRRQPQTSSDGSTSSYKSAAEAMEVDPEPLPPTAPLPPAVQPAAAPPPSSLTPSLSDGDRSWKEVVPSDWVPVIEQDVAKQQKGNTGPQPEGFSEAYIQATPAKKRKMLGGDKKNK